MPVLLKDFDVAFKKADGFLSQFDHRLDLESANPKVWTKKQVEDLKVVAAALASLEDAISEMAARVRDD
jgi:hypothetical protein